MPQIKEAFVWYNVNTTSTLQYPSEFCSDVSFTGTIFSINWHLLFVLTLLISDLTFIFLLVSLLVSVQPDIWKIFFRIMSENNSLHKTTVHTKQLFTQNNCSHKTTVHTKQLFTQNNCSHKTIVHTKQLFTQNNRSHKTIVHPKQLFTQNNCSHKTIVHTKQLFTQNNCSHKTIVHTKQLFTQNNCSHKNVLPIIKHIWRTN